MINRGAGTKKNMMGTIEILFDLSYLFTVVTSVVLLYRGAEAGSLRQQYAVMSFVLVLGDAFHLIPRIYALTAAEKRDHKTSLGVGKFVTSITMTVFYLFLWEIGKRYYAFNAVYLSAIVYGLAIVRIILCVFPQNGWMDKKPPRKWAIIRNVPFFILGMDVMALYMAGAFKSGGALSFVWLAVLISFACYVPVVLFYGTNPKTGMLMLPKSCAYVAIVLMGFSI